MNLLKKSGYLDCKSILLLLSLHFFGLSDSYAQAFPNLGRDSTLDIACWNIEWFGNTSNGPSDESLQFNNVKYLLDRTGMDVFALAEISDATAYSNLSAALSTKYDTYISTFSQTQKTGIYWKKSMFQLIPALSFNLSLGSTDQYNFASRPPLQVALQTLTGTKTDTLYFFILHLKAYGDLDSYNRRTGSSVFLKNFLQANFTGKKFIVLGDWNDNLVTSTYNNSLSPFKNLLDAGYTFPSKELTDAGKSSYAFNTQMLDHIMQSQSLDSFYYSGSARVFDDAATYCTGFSNNTSDHFPVYARYNWTKLTTREIPSGITEAHAAQAIQVYPNPATRLLFVVGEEELQEICLWTTEGNLIIQNTNPGKSMQLDMRTVSPGIFVLQIRDAHGVTIRRIAVNN